MKRRDFIKATLAVGGFYSLNCLPPLAGEANAAGFAALNQRVLVNVMLAGGPDLRHLMPPAFNPDPQSFGFKYWEAKANSHSIAKTAAAYEARWNDDYFPVSFNGVDFGILKSCGWLKRMWDAGNVAVVCNAIGARSRNHAHSQLVLDQGNLTSGPNDVNRSGWGGRLASAAGGNVVSLTRAPRRFCFGPDPMNPLEGIDNSNLVAAPDTRQFNLYKPPQDEPRATARPIITQALKSYYEGLKSDSRALAAYERIMDSEQSIRQFGDLIDERLNSFTAPLRIRVMGNGGLGLSDPYIGLQARNLYDSLAASDILSLRVASMEFGSWDSHKEQRSFIEPKLEDLFGDFKVFDVLYQEFPTDVQDNLVLVFAGEFGRQLRANGANGCDHGRGNSVIIVGNQVNGGVYGTMFPEEELSRIDVVSADINGLTEFDHILGEVADFVVPGAGDLVFPNRSTAQIENGVTLAGLFV